MATVVHTPSNPGRSRGRPRSEERHHAVLAATRDLLTASSYEHLTMESIAATAGVSKPTLYKWWPSKAAVVTEAVIAGYLSAPSSPLTDTGDLAVDLGAWLQLRLHDATDPAASALIRAMTSATAEGNDGERLFELLAEPSRQLVLSRLRVAQHAGQIRADADLDATADVVISVLLLHALTPRPAGARTRSAGLLELLLRGLGYQA